MLEKLKNRMISFVRGRDNETPAGAENALALPSALPDDHTCTPDTGLSEDEAARRAAAGLSNRATEDGGKSFREILCSNLFTFFNILNFLLALGLILVGSWRNLLFLLVVIANVLIGTVQEIRARNTIRRMQLLNASHVSVIRNGKEIPVDVKDTVKGDLCVLRAGDQVPADAVVTGGNGSAMESLLTGESTPVKKNIGDWLYSGSYITEGKLVCQLVYVADESYAGRLTAEAKKTARPRSALMCDLEKLIRFDSIILIPAGLLLFLKKFLIEKIPLADYIPAGGAKAVSGSVASSVAAMIGMIPEGLMLLTGVALAVGVIKLGRKHTLVQELYGIESLARVDVLCLDKTGTLTTGDMTVEEIRGIDATDQEAEDALARFAGAFDEQGGTMRAVKKRVKVSNENPAAVLPFSSERKMSAAAFADGTVLIMGAPSFVLHGEKYTPDLRAQTEELSRQGKRVTVLALSHGTVEGDRVPDPEKVMGLVILTDEIRPSARETAAYFKQQGVVLKVISGDDPRTVSRIAETVGIDGAQDQIDASTLKGREEIAAACEKYTVFGRVTPVQKKLLVEELKKRGHSVAMTGDGVNDIPAMKAADCSLAMAGGADAARHAAQVTLLDSGFAALPDIVLEGRRVINNITRTATLFLTKTIFSFLLCMLMLFLPGAYPFEPIQLTLVSAFTVGMPSFFLALEPCDERVKGDFLRKVLLRALPGGLAVALCACLSMQLGAFGLEKEIFPTIATLCAATVSYIVLVRVSIPLSRLRMVVLAAVPVLFAAAVLILGALFKLEPIGTKGAIAYLCLAVPGCGIVFGTGRLTAGLEEKRKRNK